MPKHSERLLIGNVKGPPGKDSRFIEVTTEVDGQYLEVPSVEATLGGEPQEQTIHFLFKGFNIPKPVPVVAGGTGATTVPGIYETLDIVPVEHAEIDAMFA